MEKTHVYWLDTETEIRKIKCLNLTYISGYKSELFYYLINSIDYFLIFWISFYFDILRIHLNLCLSFNNAIMCFVIFLSFRFYISI